jgi:lipoprotein LprG
MRLHRGLTAVALGAATALALTACSGDDPAPAADSRTTDAADAPTAVVEEETTGLTPENFAQRTVAALVKAETMSMGMEMAAEGQTVTMTGQVRMTKSTMDMTVDYDMLGMTFDMIMIDGKVYMGTGGQYQEMSPQEMGADSVDELMAQTDARAQIESLKGAIVSVEPQGEEEIEGIPTTHYLVTVDPTKLTNVDPAAAAAMGDSFGYDYWLDEADRTVRMAYAVQGVDASITYSNFGEPVEITAPDPSTLTTGLF